MMFKIKIIGLLLFMSAFTSHPVCGEDILTSLMIPEDHPILPALSQIFQEGESVIANEESLIRAGFEIFRSGRNRNGKLIYVVSHRDIPGYLLKLYTSEQEKVHGVRYLLGRAKNARKVQGIIDREGYHSLIQVPKEWIYFIPNTVTASTKRENDRLCCALIVERMDILTKKESLKIWKSHVVTPELVDTLFLFFRKSRLTDLHAGNIPFCKNGKVACVDLDPHTKRCLRRTSVGKLMLPEMRAYWESLFGDKEEIRFH